MYVCIYIYYIIEREREENLEAQVESGNHPTLPWCKTPSHEAWDRAQQARPGVLSSSTLAEAGKVLKSSYSFFLARNAMLVPTEEVC